MSSQPSTLTSFSPSPVTLTLTHIQTLHTQVEAVSSAIMDLQEQAAGLAEFAHEGMTSVSATEMMATGASQHQSGRPVTEADAAAAPMAQADLVVAVGAPIPQGTEALASGARVAQVGGSLRFLGTPAEGVPEAEVAQGTLIQGTPVPSTGNSMLTSAGASNAAAAVATTSVSAPCTTSCIAVSTVSPTTGATSSTSPTSVATSSISSIPVATTSIAPTGVATSTIAPTEATETGEVATGGMAGVATGGVATGAPATHPSRRGRAAIPGANTSAPRTSPAPSRSGSETERTDRTHSDREGPGRAALRGVSTRSSGSASGPLEA